MLRYIAEYIDNPSDLIHYMSTSKYMFYILYYHLDVILSYTTFHTKTLKCIPKFFGVPIKCIDMKVLRTEDNIYLNNITHLNVDSIYYNDNSVLPNVIHLHKRIWDFGDESKQIVSIFPNIRTLIYPDLLKDIDKCKELVHLQCACYRGNLPPKVQVLQNTQDLENITRLEINHDIYTKQLINSRVLHLKCNTLHCDRNYLLILKTLRCDEVINTSNLIISK
jgi:hypothetical protein